MLIIVGQGLAGTLAGLEAERKGQSFLVVDQGSGANSSRAAAGIFNPLTGPRFTSDGQGWDQILAHYRDLEQRLGVGFVHPMILARPLTGAKTGPADFPRSAPGWSAVLCPHGTDNFVHIEGGGWIDLPCLLDTVRETWRRSGKLEERIFDPWEGRNRKVLWCGGINDFTGSVWSTVPGVLGLWQGVRGDVLTVRIPNLGLDYGIVGSRFLIPLGNNLYRWGATHESDVLDLAFRPEARNKLEEGLKLQIKENSYEVKEHNWGIRPSSRIRTPLILRHPDEPEWTLFNGFGGRGVCLVPRCLKLINGL